MTPDRDRLRELLQAADCVPDAPDCRRAVMDRIASPAPRFRLAWAYTAMAVLLVGLIMGSVIYFAPSEPAGKPRVVKVTPPASEKPVADKTAVQPMQPEEPKASLTPPAPEPVKVAVEKPKHGFTHVRRAQQVVEQTPVEKPIPAAPEPAARYDENAPVALVVVSGPTTEPSGGYGYTQTDTETGRVTNCSVTRTGNSIEIYLESTPGEDTPPVKGSLDYEIPNA